MKFLLPVGGITDHRFGILTNYHHRSIPSGIKGGMQWGGDAPVFGSKPFEINKWLEWIEVIEPYKKTCLFIVCPDVVGDAAATIKQFNKYNKLLDEWPIAFVGQDGQEDLDFPDQTLWKTLFIGGSTGWKESKAAIDVIRRAQALDKHIHIGRVNWGRRYKQFKVLKGSEGFTCDGTRTRFEGTQKTIRAWAAYQAQDALFGI